MKILSVADTVTQTLLDPVKGGPFLDGVNVIFSCGDLPPEYLTALKNRYDAPLYYILGNHDIRYRNSPPTGCSEIHRKLFRFNEFYCAGFSGSRWYNGGINQFSEKQMARYVKKMRFALWRNSGLDIVITHAPPRFIGDAEDLCHRGFRIFRWLIKKYQPSYFIHGHIHAHFDDDAKRISKMGQTTVINSYGYHVLEI